MHFKLFYKSYDFDDLSHESIKWYKQETGRDMRSDLLGVINRMGDKDVDHGVRLENIMRHIGDIDGATILGAIAKSKNSALQLSEISDAVIRSGWRVNDSSCEFRQPYTYVLYKLAVDIDKYYEEDGVKTKKAFSLSSVQQG